MCIGYCMLGIESTTMHQELWDKPFELIKETKTIYLYLFVVFYTVFSYTTSRMHQVGGNRTRGEDKVTSIHRLLIKKIPGTVREEASMCWAWTAQRPHWWQAPGILWVRAWRAILTRPQRSSEHGEQFLWHSICYKRSCLIHVNGKYSSIGSKAMTKHKFLWNYTPVNWSYSPNIRNLTLKYQGCS